MPPYPALFSVDTASEFGWIIRGTVVSCDYFGNQVGKVVGGTPGVRLVPHCIPYILVFPAFVQGNTVDEVITLIVSSAQGA